MVRGKIASGGDRETDVQHGTHRFGSQFFSKSGLHIFGKKSYGRRREKTSFSEEGGHEPKRDFYDLDLRDCHFGIGAFGSGWGVCSAGIDFQGNSKRHTNAETHTVRYANDVSIQFGQAYMDELFWWFGEHHALCRLDRVPAL